MRRRRRCNGDISMAVLCIAFGVGVFLALFCSLKLVLILAVIFLVVLGLASLKC